MLVPRRVASFSRLHAPRARSRAGGHVGGGSITRLPWLVWVLVPAMVTAGAASARFARAAGAVAVLPLAQVSLTELQATQQARQQMEAQAADPAARPQMNPENAAAAPGEPSDAGAGAEAASAPAGGGSLLKYLPAYVLLVLFTALGVAAVGRPVKRVAPDGT